MKRNAAHILFLLLISSSLFAQKFEVSVDKTTVAIGEQFQVYFTFSGGDANKVSGFRGPVFKDFIYLGGPNQSTSVQIINGKVSGNITYSYVLSPKAVGEFLIGSAQVNYDGKQYETKPLKIKVVKGNASAKKQKNGSDSSADIAKNLFIRAFVDKTKAYVGEQVTLTYKLYTRLNISSPQISKLPSYNGFWAEELDTDNRINFDIEMYNGQRFRSAVIKKVALFPTKSGELKITPFELNIPVQIRKRRTSGNSLFDEFFNDSFFGRTETVDFTAKSNAVKIKVLPLPEAGKPASFSGAVGNFNFNSSIDKTDVKTNESVTITFTVNGTGNIKLLELPKITLPPGFEEYDPKQNENIKRISKVSGVKKVEYLFVPRVPGKKEIPAVEFSYFNPKTKKYVTKTAGPFVINVERDGSSSYAQTGTGFSKEDVKLLGKDIRYIKTSDFEYERISDLKGLQSWFWFAIFIPAFVLFVAVGVKKRQDKISGNVTLMRSSKAEKTAKAKLKIAKKALDAGEEEKFYDEISKALFGYLEDKLTMQKADFSLERAADELRSREIADELIDKVKEISEKCEFARFAPESMNQKAEQNLYDETLSLIVKLENSIKKKK